MLTHLVPWHPAEEVLAEGRAIRPAAVLAEQGSSSRSVHRPHSAHRSWQRAVG